MSLLVQTLIRGFVLLLRKDFKNSQFVDFRDIHNNFQNPKLKYLNRIIFFESFITRNIFGEFYIEMIRI